MSKTLGIDLGSNSLGWAILDDITGDILESLGTPKIPYFSVNPASALAFSSGL